MNKHSYKYSGLVNHKVNWVLVMLFLCIVLLMHHLLSKGFISIMVSIPVSYHHTIFHFSYILPPTNSPTNSNQSPKGYPHYRRHSWRRHQHKAQSQWVFLNWCWLSPLFFLFFLFFTLLLFLSFLFLLIAPSPTSQTITINNSSTHLLTCSAHQQFFKNHKPTNYNCT